MGRTRLAALLVSAMIVGVASTALAGCGAGQLAQTAEQVSAVTGASATQGDIAVRDARIEFPPDGGPAGSAYRRGGSAPVAMTIVNVSNQADRLVSASSPVADEVVVEGDAVLPGGFALVTGSVAGTPLPATKPIRLELSSLTEDIRPGLTYPLTLVFERAGSLTLDVPVGISDAAPPTAPPPAADAPPPEAPPEGGEG